MIFEMDFTAKKLFNLINELEKNFQHWIPIFTYSWLLDIRICSRVLFKVNVLCFGLCKMASKYWQIIGILQTDKTTII